MAVQLSQKAFERVSAVIKKVERTPINMAGPKSGTTDLREGFWAMLLGSDTSGIKYTFIKCILDPTSVMPEFFTTENTLRWGFDETSTFAEAAVDVNGTRGLPFGTIVWMRFGGYGTDSKPIFLFEKGTTDPAANGLPLHDHRDNFNGGFAFSMYHPGTAIPQMPWSQ